MLVHPLVGLELGFPLALYCEDEDMSDADVLNSASSTMEARSD